ncbi:glutaredoxin-1 [Alligator mississippiensis]|uniref:Glutaredoxin-1 n=1 Tax=Alligator mississippiensis TaxID=8496 RepID=A0A151PIB4_ALLMI|nr:glutaredoxin-1 [Alligator mississippiensis]
MSQQFVKSKLGANKVAVFIKPTCPYCQEAIELLKKYTFKPGHLEFIDLTARNDMSSIQDYFLQSTGARTVPRVYIGEVCIGVVQRMEMARSLPQESWRTNVLSTSSFLF